MEKILLSKLVRDWSKKLCLCGQVKWEKVLLLLILKVFFLSVQRKNTSYKRHKDFLMFSSPCDITELQIHFKSVCSPLVILPQGKGHICLLFYAATKLSDIRSGWSFSSRGTWTPLPAEPFYPGPAAKGAGKGREQVPALRAGSGAGSQRAIALQEWGTGDAQEPSANLS